MTSFHIDKKLTSHEVTRELLERIEKYLLAELPKIINVSPEDLKEEYSISITDSLGSEVIESISEFRLPLFPDDTEEIGISVAFPISFVIRIRFGLARNSSSVIIDYEGEDARRIATSIYEDIARLLDYSRTNYHIWHGGIISIIFWLIGFFLVIVLISFRSYTAMITVLFAIATLAVVRIFSLKIHPHTLFDSRRGRNYKKWHDWFIYGIFGSILADAAVALVLNRFFGLI